MPILLILDIYRYGVNKIRTLFSCIIHHGNKQEQQGVA